jgi:hypothetical protein
MGATRVAVVSPRTARVLGAIGVGYALQQLALTSVAALDWKDSATVYLAGLAACPNNHRLHLARAATMESAGARREGAWELLIASAIVRRFPAEIPASTFPIAWTEVPMDARLSALRALLATEDEFEAVRHLAIDVGNRYGVYGSAAELLRWPTPVAVPPWDPRWSAPDARALEPP